MSQIDHRKVYRLGPSIEKAPKLTTILENDMPLCQVVDEAVGFGASDKKYRVHRRAHNEAVEFSTDKFNDAVPEILVLNVYGKKWDMIRRKTIPVVALRYQVGKRSYINEFGIRNWAEYPDWNKDPENYLGICYVQTMTGVNVGLYREATQILDVRPHEFITAQFLSRVAPVLHARPQTKVVLKGTTLTSRKELKERFFDKKWRLNPNKERVRQILGPENAWLTPEAIESRRKEIKKPEIKKATITSSLLTKLFSKS